MNNLATLVYVPFLGWMAAIVVLIIEKDKTLRFHAVQSLLTYGAYFGLGISGRLLQFTVVLAPAAWALRILLGVGFLGLWLGLAVKTHQGEKIKLPYLGQWAERILAHP